MYLINRYYCIFLQMRGNFLNSLLLKIISLDFITRERSRVHLCRWMFCFTLFGATGFGFFLMANILCRSPAFLDFSMDFPTEGF